MRIKVTETHLTLRHTTGKIRELYQNGMVVYGRYQDGVLESIEWSQDKPGDDWSVAATPEAFYRANRKNWNPFYDLTNPDAVLSLGIPRFKVIIDPLDFHVVIDYGGDILILRNPEEYECHAYHRGVAESEYIMCSNYLPTNETIDLSNGDTAVLWIRPENANQFEVDKTTTNLWSDLWKQVAYVT